VVQQGDASLLRRAMTAGHAPLPAAAAPQRGKRATIARKEAARRRPPATAGDVVIDVIVAYSNKAASNYGDMKRELVDLAIEEANHSFRMSNLPHIKRARACLPDQLRRRGRTLSAPVEICRPR
jgi:hypothetical protein